MRRHVHLVIVLSLNVFAFGCPSTSTTPPSIEEVYVDGDPRSDDFSLEISGRGFATELTYDLSSGSGRASSALRVEVYDLFGLTRVPADPAKVRVTSPREIIAGMNRALEAGVWGVRIFDGDQFLAEKDEAFRVNAIVGGDDAGEPDPPDTGEVADGGVNPDAEPADAIDVDAGLPDTGIPADTGVPFQEAYQYRQLITLTNQTGMIAPRDTTVLIPVAHGMMTAMMMSKPDATDIAIYLGNNELPYQWDDRVKIGTNELVMVAKLTSTIAAGLHNGEPLMLYFGDPAKTNVPSDEVFVFAERFALQLDDNEWFVNSGWQHCNNNRPIEGQAPPGAYCFQDGGNNPTRRSLATPLIPEIGAGAIATNQKYELTLWSAGIMVDQQDDLLYFSYDDVNDLFETTTLIPAAEWVGFQPNVAGFDFEENDGSTRIVEGWRYATAVEWWRRSTARFKPMTYVSTSLHFRFVSRDGTDNGNTGGAIDDVVVRRALDPEFMVEVGTVEQR